MKRILVSNLYFYRLDSKQWRFRQPYPPLATIIACAVLRSEGFITDLFDTNLRHSPEEISDALSSHLYDYVVFYDDSFNYLSKMCLTAMREAAFVMIAMAKKNGCRVIVASSDANDHSGAYLDAGADVIIKGEAEKTLEEVVHSLNTGAPLPSVAGIVTRLDGKEITTHPRGVIKDLDSLPFPAWDLVDIASYRDVWIHHHGYFSLNIATTRGCPFKCNWCAKPVYGNRYNCRTPERVAEEVEYLITEYQVNHFWVCDDIFGLKPGWIQDFNRIVKRRNLKFRYKIQSRVDLLLQQDTIKALAESGAETVWVGAESGSQKILDAMDKGTTVEEIYAATSILKENGLRVAFFLQFGYPGETLEDINKTIRMVLELMPDEVGISVSYPLPGTKFYEKVKDQLKEKQNWSDSDDLAMMFQNTFQNNFYKNLHRLVHSLYRRKKGLLTLQKILHRPFRFSFRDVKPLAGIVYFGLMAQVQKARMSRLSKPDLISQTTIQ
jgi:anaerobic magnesium-protoporphyrin IX monomethyl ester cyclase